MGHFDGVHVGHRAVIGLAVEKAVSIGAVPAVFTFDGDLKKRIKGSEFLPVYTIDKRRSLIKDLGVEEFFVAPVSEKFLSLSGREFLDLLNDEYDVFGYVTGSDYCFGRNAECDVSYLEGYAAQRGQRVYIVPDVILNGQRVSTTLIKENIKDGNVKKANIMLGTPYSVTGKVLPGRKVGRNLGFPTVNLAVNDGIIGLKCGVYQGYATLFGKKYDAVINYGARPTFSLNEKLIEAHLIGFSGDLYDKEITLYFTDFIREVMSFATVEDLRIQLRKDVLKVKSND